MLPLWNTVLWIFMQWMQEKSWNAFDKQDKKIGKKKRGYVKLKH